MAHILNLDACYNFAGVDLRTGGIAPSVLARYAERGKKEQESGKAKSGGRKGGKRGEAKGKSARQEAAEDWLETLSPRPPATPNPPGEIIIEDGLCEDCGQPFVSRRMRSSRRQRRFCDACRSRRSVEASRRGMAKARQEKADGKRTGANGGVRRGEPRR